MKFKQIEPKPARKKLNEKMWDDSDYWAEPKLDGHRAVAQFMKSGVRFTSRHYVTVNKKKTNNKTTKAKAKPAKAPREDLVVFAFRLTEAERAAVHKTAGPSRASRYVRQVAAAFAKEDEGAFKAVLKEAREAGS